MVGDSEREDEEDGRRVGEGKKESRENERRDREINRGPGGDQIKVTNK